MLFHQCENADVDSIDGMRQEYKKYKLLHILHIMTTSYITVVKRGKFKFVPGAADLAIVWAPGWDVPPSRLGDTLYR
jgi:hypothetical protein